MANPTDTEIRSMHARFAAGCFNQAWKGIDSRSRTVEEEEAMLSAAHASFWHWSQRDDFAPRNRSVAYWQLSRVYALVGAQPLAQRFAERCIEVGEAAPLPPFFVGYGYEALSRARVLARDWVAARVHLEHAQALTDQVESEESRRLLQDDLTQLRGLLHDG
jgi:hypothetical protein